MERPVEPEKVIASAIHVVESEVRSVATQLPTVERQALLRSVKTATEAIERHEASSREELRHLRLVASTSTLLLIFSHEVKSLLSWLEQVSISLERVRRQIGDTEAAKIAAIRDEFQATKERFLDLLSMTSLISIDSRKTEPEMVTLAARLERAKACFDLIAKAYQIDIQIEDVPRSLQVGPMLEAEVYAVLLNVLSNAVKSVIAAGGVKVIKVTAAREGQEKVLHVLDTGIGLKRNSYEEVFAPFVADPENRLYRGLQDKLNPEDKYIVGTGSGLGLSIVREILASRGGRIQFLAPQHGWKANLEIVLP